MLQITAYSFSVCLEIYQVIAAVFCEAQATKVNTISGNSKRKRFAFYWHALQGIVYCTRSKTQVLTVKHVGCTPGEVTACLATSQLRMALVVFEK